MRTRHRIPSIFNLSMVDVLCCALGCIILLWLVKARDAGATRAQLKEAEKSLALEKKYHDDLLKQVGDLRKLLALVRASLADGVAQKNKLEDDLARLRNQHAAAEDGLALRAIERRLLEDEIAGLKKKNAERAKSLARLTDDHRQLLKELAALKVQSGGDKAELQKKVLALADLEKALAALRAESTQDRRTLREKTTELANLLTELAALKKLAGDDRAELRKKTLALGDLEKVLAALKREKTDVEKNLSVAEDNVKQLRAQARDLRTRLTLADARQLALEKDLGERQKELAAAGRELEDTRKKLLRELEGARASIAGLQRDKKALAGQVTRAREEAERRFAGIALTGKRVIFLVDMSGSMELVDDKTAAPEKWKGVRETLAKVMRSLPDLEKFQVILFSDKVTYLLGSSDLWLDYNPRTSVDRVTRALAAIKPTGGTDMHAGFQAAFRFRQAGLDTIYVLSDGLPNMGAGLTAEDARRLNDSQQAEILSKYIRNKLKTEWNRSRSGQRVRINTIGFFFESPDVGAFLWALARENDGSFVGMSKP
jgi:predicted  nucleic acid-binding Zn-ribbon protein